MSQGAHEGLSLRRLNRLSLASVRLRQFRRGTEIGHGTGFLVALDGEGSTALVTAWHVLTGRSPTEPSRTVADYPDSPDELRWQCITRNDTEIWYPELGGIAISPEFEFVEHELRSEGIDIAVLRIEFGPESVPFPLRWEDIQSEGPGVAGTDAMIVGFPFPGDENHFLPIWKRATVASEPHSPAHGAGRYLLDSASRPGMSGAPVYRVHHEQRVAVDTDTVAALRAYKAGEVTALDFLQEIDPDVLSGTPYSRNRYEFAGIYSGRLADDSPDLDLGIAMTPYRVQEVLTSGVITGHPVPASLSA